MMTVGLVLVLAAVCLTAYNIWDENRAGKALEQVLGEIDSMTESDLIEGNVINVPEVPQSTDDETDMPTLTLDRSKYIGILEIPVLGLRLPIMEEWNYPNLKVAPCRYTGSIYQSDMVIAGHNYRSHFGSLNRLRVGDELLFIDMDGNRFVYTVAETETLMPREIEHMITGDWDLTLFTCTYGGRTRFTVRCVAQSVNE